MKIKGLLAGLEREWEAPAPLPLHVVLLIDCSGSIKEHLEVVKRAASFLGWDHFDTLYALGLGLLLHDLDKRRLPWRIMKRPDPLGLTEWVITKKHPFWGARALRESLATVPDGVYLPIEQHHEQLDGKGYPQGLKGKEIHPFGRVAAIADIYDILTSDRPGHGALPSPEALRLMDDEMGDQLDPELLHAFILCLGDKGPVLPVGMS